MGKYAHVGMKLENVVMDTNYAITVSLANPGKSLMNGTELYQKQIFSKWSTSGFVFQMFPELGPTGHLHYHGVISFSTKLKIVSFFLWMHSAKSLCTYEFDTCNDDWFDVYCQKQRSILEPVLKSLKLPYCRYPVNYTETLKKNTFEDYFIRADSDDDSSESL